MYDQNEVLFYICYTAKSFKNILSNHGKDENVKTIINETLRVAKLTWTLFFIKKV